MADDKSFWLVWNPRGWTPPRIKHSEEATAVAEAERLARENPGQAFFVVRAVAVSVVPPSVLTTRLIDDDEIPF